MKNNLTNPPAKNRKLSVFLSYVTEDKNIVREIYAKLKNFDFNLWFDKENLLGGQDWTPEIEKAIKKSNVVIICLSKKSKTKESFYQREIKHALLCDMEKPPGTIYIIPLLLEECEIPYHLKCKQSIHYFENSGISKLIKTLNTLSNNSGLPHIIPSPYIKKSNPNIEEGISPYSDIPGSECAVRLSPLNYPTILNKVKFFITDDEEPRTKFKVNIYDANNNNRPGNRLNNFDIFGEDGNGNKWVEIDISDHKIFISKGDFFVSMEWLKAPGEDGDFAQYVQSSKNPDRPGRTFLKHGNNGKWWRKNTFNCWIHAIDSLGNEIMP